MNRKGLIVIVATLIVLPLLLYASINIFAYLSTKGELYSLEETDLLTPTPDAILVLGAGVRSNGTPSNMLEDRLLTALALYEEGAGDTIIVSGDHGSKDYDEVNVMKRYLVDKGIPSDRIFMDHAGFSTYDSLYRAEAVFGAKSIIIVTQRYHAYRSLMIGKSLGLECEAVAAPILSSDVSIYPKQPWYSFRESIARCKDFVFCMVHSKPTYLGEPISLKGSGDVTNDKDQ